MNSHSRRVQIHVDNYTRVCLSFIAILLTVLVLGLWTQTAPLPSAQAADGNQPPTYINSADQRAAQIDAQKQTTAKLDELIALLKSGDAKIQVVDNGKK